MPPDLVHIYQKLETLYIIAIVLGIIFGLTHLGLLIFALVMWAKLNGATIHLLESLSRYFDASTEQKRFRPPFPTPRTPHDPNESYMPKS